MIELWSQRRNVANESANVGKVAFVFLCDFYFSLYIFIDMGLQPSWMHCFTMKKRYSSYCSVINQNELTYRICFSAALNIFHPVN